MRLPRLDTTLTALEAARALVDAGFAVLPVSQGNKSPGSLLGNGWPDQSARTPADVDRLWALYPDSAVAVHTGACRPPVVVIDADDAAKMPSDLMHALTEMPFTSSRNNDEERGHYWATVPTGRDLGSSKGQLKDFGIDVRAGNTVAIAHGTHKLAADGGRYLTGGGELPELPASIAGALPDRGITGQADDAGVAAFLAALPGGTCPEIADRVRDGVAELLAAKVSHDRGGTGRHEPGLRIVKGLVRLGERRFPGVREALAEVESAFMAGREGNFDGRTDWPRSLRGAVGAVTKDPSPASEFFVDTGPMLAAMRERKQKERATVGAAQAEAEPVEVPGRRLKLTPASEIRPRPVHWLWTGRMPLGALTLCAGREGIGKSSVMYAVAAQVTRGTLPGRHHGTPRAVIVCATEDSWEHTIAPRLMAAGADLERVFRVEVETTDFAVELTLPKDHAELERAVRETDAALVLLDPLMSRVDAKIDTHNDQQTRQALEPLVKVADRTRCAVVGLIHLNKSKPEDILTAVMGSRAFSAVARSVLVVQVDPDDERTALLGVAKANLTSKLDVPQLAFRIESVHVTDTDEGPVEAGRVVWVGERTASVADTYTAAGEDPETRTLVAEAAAWLVEFLTGQGGAADLADIRLAHEQAKTDFGIDALKRARKPARVASTRTSSVPSRTRWSLRSVQSGHPLTAPTALTAPSALTGAEQGRHT